MPGCRDKEHLIRLFTMDGKPYELHYNYRTAYGGYKEDKALLDAMIKEGTVVQIGSSNKQKKFLYTGA